MKPDLLTRLDAGSVINDAEFAEAAAAIRELQDLLGKANALCRIRQQALAEREATIQKMRNALEVAWSCLPIDTCAEAMSPINSAIFTPSPTENLKRYRDAVLEEAATKCDYLCFEGISIDGDYCAKAIRAMKEEY